MVGVPQAPLAKEMQEVTSKQTITAAEVEVQCQGFPGGISNEFILYLS